ncbi:hypothetical protein [Proteiniclasticum ruminis]|uniref:Uncharacterized protein n=1 Tax=Proteiniclasticum ruminis TaxID=398199 RepID=A0A1I5ETM2_9CLOT|nr:hypothetical protein [Proteiniclasticum ruminis]SFO14797.1 hypothetical protein SAMN04488695_1211 [Proteiniclasticum ruminis]
MENNLYRLGALMFDDDSSSFSRKTTIRKIIEAFFVLKENCTVLCSELPELVKDAFDIELHIDEIQKVLYNSKNFEFIGGHCQKQHSDYCSLQVHLTIKRYELVSQKEYYNSIYRYIDEYYNSDEEIRNIITNEEFTKLIEDFLYSVFVQNIAKSSRMFDVSIDKKDLLTDLKVSEERKKIINSFLDYDDDNKNKAIYNIGSLAIEYVILNGGIDLQSQESNILKKVLYLDTNIIYRLLGINGEQRKIKVRNLISRCIETGQQIKISYTSKKEFFDSIDYQLQKVVRYPSNIRYTEPIDNAIIKDYYDTKSGNAKFYRAKVQAEYEDLIREFSIVEEKYDFYGTARGKDRLAIDRYASSIAGYKNKTLKEALPDATNTYYIEKLRSNQGKTFRELKEFFLTSDKNLINWETEAKETYPVTIYPSNWLSIILRFGSRTNDDYRSFVSFIRNVPHEEKRDLDVVLATMQVIAQKAETAEKQKALFEIFVENEYESILKKSNFEEKIIYIEETIPPYIDRMFEEQSEVIRRLEEQSRLNTIKQQKEIENLRHEFEEDKSSDDKQRLELCEEKFNSEIADRKLRLVISIIVFIGCIIGLIYTLPNILSVDNTNKSKILIEFFISSISFPVLLWSIKNIYKTSSVKSLKQDLLLKEITKQEIDLLLENRNKLFLVVLFF